MAVVEVQAETITFTAGDIVNWMAQQGDPLHNATDVWGITRVRVIPAVSVPGGYTINLEECSISSNTVSWRVQTDAVGNPPYGNGVTDTGLHASFNDTHLYSWQGSLYYSGTVYVISDLSPADFAARFPQYYSGTHPDLPLAEMPANTVFTLNFTLNPGVTWLNQGFYFLVDGVWYNNWYAGASYTNPIGFNGGYGMDSIPYAGDLKGDMGYGYYGTSTPLPSSLILLTSGLLSLWWLRKKAQV
jgi:hypothetical protein